MGSSVPVALGVEGHDVGGDGPHTGSEEAHLFGIERVAHHDEAVAPEDANRTVDLARLACLESRDAVVQREMVTLHGEVRHIAIAILPTEFAEVDRRRCHARCSPAVTVSVEADGSGIRSGIDRVEELDRRVGDLRLGVATRDRGRPIASLWPVVAEERMDAADDADELRC